MLRELISIFRSDNPLAAMGQNFQQMLQLAYELTVKAGELYFGTTPPPEDRTWIYEQDVQINKLQRKIRKQVIAHLSLRNSTPDLPYCLLLVSLVKDVERIGDYAKNLSEVCEIRSKPLPEDDILAELREIRVGVEAAFSVTAKSFETLDRNRAVVLIQQGKDIAHRCDALIEKIARSNHDARTTTALVLGTRFYKRFIGHILNVLSSVVMPLHKLDYYDEKELEPRPTT